jgi:hypothetical protein
MPRLCLSGVSRIATPLLLACVVAACSATHPYSPLLDDGEPLRARFNRDAGKTRIVMLVAPT